MASKILVDELAPYSHATDVTLATGKKIAGANTQFKITGGSNTNVLTTDGSGGLTWGAAAGGKVLQVLQSVNKAHTASTTVSTTTFADIAGTDQDGAGAVWCVKITPAATTSKILITWAMTIGAASDMRMNAKIQRDSTDIFVGDTGGSRIPTSVQTTVPYEDGMSQTVGTYLDSPVSTSLLEYKVVWSLKQAASTLYLNRSYDWPDNTSMATATSTITVMEIGA
jgi:hypothetical protein